METNVTEIADSIYRLSTYVPDIPPAGFTFNQFLVVGEETLLFHSGPRMMFPSISAAVARVTPLEQLRWITFGHVESDECGSMNLWLDAAPRAEVAHGVVGVLVSLNDLADRPPRALADDEVIDLGSRRLRHLDTPHVPHAWEARVLFEETTKTLLCGDLFTHIGNPPALTHDDIVGPAIEGEDIFHASSLHPSSGSVVRRLADLDPKTVALMHGASFAGDGGEALRRLADDYDRRVSEAWSTASRPREGLA
jgi:flavorubredoxin